MIELKITTRVVLVGALLLGMHLSVPSVRASNN
jgi:hypothetical protein